MNTDHLDAICQRIENTKARMTGLTGDAKARFSFAIQQDEKEKRQEMEFLSGGKVDDELDALNDDEIFERLFGNDEA